MRTIDLSSADYAGGFNISERDGETRVSGFTKANGGRAYPRTRAADTVRAADGISFELTSDCLVTRADGTRYRIAKGTRKGASAPRKGTSARKPPETTTTPLTRADAPIKTTAVVSSYDARHAEQY
jgi:hypothetical protein